MAAKTERETKSRMACWNCPRYSRTERQCADGKANPKKKADSVMVAEVLGLRALCHYNTYRDALAARMYFPNTPLGLTSVPPKRARQGKYGTLTLPDEALPATTSAVEITSEITSLEMPAAETTSLKKSAVETSGEETC